MRRVKRARMCFHLCYPHSKFLARETKGSSYVGGIFKLGHKTERISPLVTSDALDSGPRLVLSGVVLLAGNYRHSGHAGA